MTCTEAIKALLRDDIYWQIQMFKAYSYVGEKTKIGYNCYLQYSFFKNESGSDREINMEFKGLLKDVNQNVNLLFLCGSIKCIFL